MFTRNALLARRLIFTVGSGFALALILIGALTALGLWQLEETNARLEAIVQENSVKTRLANQMRDILRDRAISMLSIVVVSDPFEKDEEMLRFYSFGSAYQKVRLELEKLANRNQEKTALANIDRLTRMNQPVMVRTVDLAVEGYTFLAFEVLQREALPLQQQLVQQLDHLIQFQRDLTGQAASEAHRNYTRTRSLMLLLGTLAVLVAGGVAWAVVRRTARLAAATEREGTKFQTLFETNTDGIVILDGEGFIDCNNATLEMFRMGSKAEFLACRPKDLGQEIQTDGDTAESLAERNIRLAMQQGHAFFDWIGRRPDGSTFPANLALHAMTLDGRTVIQAIMRDVSAQKEIEETLKRARDAALSATEMKSQFVANVSHEIRTPMNGIMGMTKLLLATELTPRQRDYAETVAGSAESLMKIINDLLDFSKIEAGRLTLEQIDFDLWGQLRQILDLYKPRTDAKGLVLSMERQGGLQDWVRGDPLRLRQILLNLLDNAIKFTQRGEIHLVAEALAEVPGHIRFSVRDTGPGMSPEVQTRIFQAFAQGDGSVTRKYGGTGLGLTICRQLAELMGGSLTLESAPGRGSTFHLTLPLPESRPPRQTLPSRTPELYFPETRVLVAEDNPVNQKLTRYMLEHLGVTVLLTGDGKMAYERLREEFNAQRPVDLILMDFQMPEWDGLTATRAIRDLEHAEGRPRLPILALTANAMAGFEQRCEEAGMDGVLTKPLTDEVLVAALARWLPEHARARRASDAGREIGAPPSSDSPIYGSPRLFNLGKIRKLCQDDPMRMEEMLRLFITSSEALLDALSLAINTKDAVQAVRQAHQIKGAAAYLGADDMTRHAAATEQRAKAGDCQGCVDTMEELESAFIALRLEIEKEIKQLGSRG